MKMMISIDKLPVGDREVISKQILQNQHVSKCFRWASIQYLENILKGLEKQGKAVNAWVNELGPRFWLLDTGAAQDMISRHHVPSKLVKKIYEVDDGIHLNTANGIITVNERLPYKLDLGAVQEVHPWILEDTPAVISIGQLVMKHGYGFYWHPYQDAYLVDPKGATIADIETIGYVPMWEDRRGEKRTTYQERYGVPAPVIPPKQLPAAPAKDGNEVDPPKAKAQVETITLRLANTKRKGKKKLVLNRKEQVYFDKTQNLRKAREKQYEKRVAKAMEAEEKTKTGEFLAEHFAETVEPTVVEQLVKNDEPKAKKPQVTFNEVVTCRTIGKIVPEHPTDMWHGCKSKKLVERLSSTIKPAIQKGKPPKKAEDMASTYGEFAVEYETGGSSGSGGAEEVNPKKGDLDFEIEEVSQTECPKCGRRYANEDCSYHCDLCRDIVGPVEDHKKIPTPKVDNPKAKPKAKPHIPNQAKAEMKAQGVGESPASPNKYLGKKEPKFTGIRRSPTTHVMGIDGKIYELGSKAHAESVDHKCGHRGKNSHCPTCQVAGMRRKQRRPKNEKRTCLEQKALKEQFGWTVTLDHLIGRHADSDEKTDPKKTCLVIRDHYTKWIEGHHKASKSAADTSRAIKWFAGDEEINNLYSDRAPELNAAAKQRGIHKHARSLPHVHQSNGLIERTIGSVLNGIRNVLFAAGVPLTRWPLAMEYWCMWNNAARDEEGSSPHLLRFGKQFAAEIHPFGSLVYFKPHPEIAAKYGKMATVGVAGIFLGWEMQPGGKWSTGYRCVAIDDLKGKDGNMLPYKELGMALIAKMQYPDNVRRRADMPVTFPLKKAFDEATTTIKADYAPGNLHFANEEPDYIDEDEIREQYSVPAAYDKQDPCQDDSHEPDKQWPSFMSCASTQDKEIFMTEIGGILKENSITDILLNGAAPANTDVDELVVLEFCCSTTSIIGNMAPKGTKVVRLTIDDDMTTLKGMAKAIQVLRKAKRIALWGSLPCTGGSVCQNANMYNPGFKSKMKAHWELFKTLWKNFTRLARMVRAKGGSVSFELPRRNKYWSHDALNEFLREMNMQKARFDGCQFGLTSKVDGRPINKPWCVATNDSFIYNALNGQTCKSERRAGHAHTICTNGEEHRWCEGVDTTPSENYTPKIAKAIHHAWRTGLKHRATAKFFEWPEVTGTLKEVNLDKHYGAPCHTLPVKLLTENAKLPTYGSPESAGLDLYSSEDIILPGYGDALVQTDIAIKIPEGCYGRVAERSGMARNHISTGAGVVDRDYRGAVGVLLRNHSASPFEIKTHDRIAQLIIERNETPCPKHVDVLDSTIRGENGFGSTGAAATGGARKHAKAPRMPCGDGDGTTYDQNWEAYSPTGPLTHDTAMAVPAMPKTQQGKRSTHREKLRRRLHNVINAIVAQPVSMKDAMRIPKAKAALQEEWNKLYAANVFNLDGVRCWYDVAEEARTSNKKVHVGDAFEICVLKGSEIADTKENWDLKLKKYKGRVVFRGNNVKDENQDVALFQELGSGPPTMCAAKICDALGISQDDFVIEQADAIQAYCQTTLKGIPTWVRLPKSQWRPEWHDAKFKGCPVVPLYKALYGHPDSGGYWEQHNEEHLKAQGFTTVPGWPSCLTHKTLKVYLTVYVDDFKISGKREDVKKAWKLVRESSGKVSEGVSIEDPAPAGRYLGCNHVIKDGWVDVDGNLVFTENAKSHKVRVMEYDMGDFMTDCVNRYVELAGGAIPACLSTVDTPGFPEVKKPENWAAKYPADLLHGVALLQKYNPGFNAGKAEWMGVIRPDETKQKAEAKPGNLGKIASRVLMKVLYGARMARYDLLKVTTSLAQRVTQWDEQCDKELHRLMCYIASSINVRMHGYVGDNQDGWSLDLFGDADFAGCKETRRSTTGVFHRIVGKYTRFPIAGVAKRQGAVSHSTPEAEIVAYAYAIRTEGLPVMDLMNAVIGRDPDLMFHEDNTATIRIIETGRSGALRHLLRTHAVNLQWLTECKRRKMYKVKYCKSEDQAADIFTKSTHDSKTWTTLLKLIGHFKVGAAKAMDSFAGRGAKDVDRSTGVKIEKKRKKQKREKAIGHNTIKESKTDEPPLPNAVNDNQQTKTTKQKGFVDKAKELVKSVVLHPVTGLI